MECHAPDRYECALCATKVVQEPPSSSLPVALAIIGLWAHRASDACIRIYPKHTYVHRGWEQKRTHRFNIQYMYIHCNLLQHQILSFKYVLLYTCAEYVISMLFRQFQIFWNVIWCIEAYWDACADFIRFVLRSLLFSVPTLLSHPSTPNANDSLTHWLTHCLT